MTKLEQGFVLRLATREDIPALRELIASSVRVLQRGDYSPAQLEAALGTVYGVDTQVMIDGRYYVVETTTDAKGKIIVACGGWSERQTLFGSDQGRTATVPCWARPATPQEYAHFSYIPTG